MRYNKQHNIRYEILSCRKGYAQLTYRIKIIEGNIQDMKILPEMLRGNDWFFGGHFEQEAEDIYKVVVYTD